MVCVFSKLPIFFLAPFNSGSGSLPLPPRSIRRYVRPRVVRLRLHLQSPLFEAITTLSVMSFQKVDGNHGGQPCNQIFKNSSFSRAAPPVANATFPFPLSRVAKIRVSVSGLSSVKFMDANFLLFLP